MRMRNIQHLTVPLLVSIGLGGTAFAQTYTPRLVADLDGREVGSDSSLAYSMYAPLYYLLQDHRSAAVGGGVVFAATTVEHGNELWFTDGTEEGTHLVRDICPGAQSSSPTRLVRVGNRVIFSAFTFENGIENWITDGTEAGTH